jgi:hypothetical protein
MKLNKTRIKLIALAFIASMLALAVNAIPSLSDSKGEVNAFALLGVFLFLAAWKGNED